jgi:DNA polymerase-3 subunit gamma/tau
MLGSAGLSRAADLFHEGLTEMRGTTAPRLLLELVCARVLLPAATSDASAVLTRIERLERRLDIATPPAAPAPPLSPVASEHTRGDAAPVVGRTEPGSSAPPVASEGTRGDAAPVVGRSEEAAADRGPASSWPAAAAPGGEPAVAEPTPAPQSPQPGVGGLDAAALRREWDRVLAAVRDAKKSAYVALGSAQVAALDGRVLTLAFTNQGPMRNFQSGANVDYLRDAISALLGVDVEVRCVFAAAQGGPASPTDSGPTAPATVHEGFAPGDEAVAEDPDEPQPPAAARHGEDAALRLVESELGGRVVGTAGE